MSRPRIKKFVCQEPKFREFSALDSASEEVVNLLTEEFEAVRLIDFMDMSQEEAAGQMRVSRPTVQILYAVARRKIADCIVNGKSLKVGGGDYIVCDDLDINCMQKNKCNNCTKQ